LLTGVGIGLVEETKEPEGDFVGVAGGAMFVKKIAFASLVVSQIIPA
jgi:hypothetical protein